MKNKEEIIVERFKEKNKKDKTFEEITKNWCPKTAGLKNHRANKDRLRCDLTCEECWKLAIAELVL